MYVATVLNVRYTHTHTSTETYTSNIYEYTYTHDISIFVYIAREYVPQACPFRVPLQTII